MIVEIEIDKRQKPGNRKHIVDHAFMISEKLYYFSTLDILTKQQNNKIKISFVLKYLFNPTINVLGVFFCDI